MLLFTIIVVLPMLITLAGVTLVLMWLDRILTVLCDMAERDNQPRFTLPDNFVFKGI